MRLGYVMIVAVVVVVSLALPAIVTSSAPAVLAQGETNRPPEDGGPTLYGVQLRPIVDRDGTTVYDVTGRIITRAMPGDFAWPLSDHLTSTRAEQGQTYEYAPFGSPSIPSSGPAPRYAGHPYDAHSQLYLTPGRSYDAPLGRFLSVDPSRQGGSPYAYAGNNPVSYLDPTGSMGIPYFVRSGFWSIADIGDVAEGVNKKSFVGDLDLAGKLGAALGRVKKQHMREVTETFGGDPFSPPVAFYNPTVFLTKNDGLERPYGERLYWFIYDQKDLVLPTHFKESVERIREHPLGNSAFARDIVLVDFTTSVNTSMDDIALFLHSQGFASSKVKVSDFSQTFATVDGTRYRLASEYEALRTHVDGVVESNRAAITKMERYKAIQKSIIREHPWIVGGKPRPYQLTPNGNQSQGASLTHHELMPLGEPPHVIDVSEGPPNPGFTSLEPYVDPEP